MECYRCGGLMILDKVYNKAIWSEGWRCSLCGEFVDQVILENRRCQKANRIGQKGTQASRLTMKVRTNE